MNRILELRSKRSDLWEQTKAFLEEHRDANGLVAADAVEQYNKMAANVQALGDEITRLENQMEMDAKLSQATSAPVHADPKAGQRKPVRPTASDEYTKAFWNQFRSKNPLTPELRNALETGEVTEGGYLVPDSFERTLIQGLNENGVVRAHARVITTSGGLHKIPVVASHGSASWIDEEGDYIESDESFGQVQLDAHKVGTIIKVSEELLQESAFNLESYISSEFSRRIGDKEEDAFLNGDGSAKPTGILNASNGGTVGVTAAAAAAITADELVDLYYSLKAPYRKNAVWILNDTTIKLIRKLKTGDGQYLWQPGIKDGEVNTILGRPYFTSPFMPVAAAGAKTIIFGDLSYYWIGDRQGITFRRLNELYAGKGQVGFMASKRLDGKTVLSEAIQILQQHA